MSIYYAPPKHEKIVVEFNELLTVEHVLRVDVYYAKIKLDIWNKNGFLSFMSMLLQGTTKLRYCNYLLKHCEKN